MRPYVTQGSEIVKQVAGQVSEKVFIRDPVPPPTTVEEQQKEEPSSKHNVFKPESLDDIFGGDDEKEVEIDKEKEIDRRRDVMARVCQVFESKVLAVHHTISASKK